MSEAAAVVEADTIPQTPFVKQMVNQMRATDSYGTYDTWPDEKVLDPLVLTKERRREIPVIGDPDEIIISRIKAYYNAISVCLEKECELMAVPMVNLSHEGFGRAIILVGKLVAVDKTLRDVHRFGFDSLEKMDVEANKIIQRGVSLIEKYRAAAED